MSQNTIQPSQAKQTLSDAMPDKPGIPVKRLYFNRQGGVDLPGGYGLSSLATVRQGNKDQYEITYHPHLRHHRIAFKPLHGQTQVTFVHESWCRWDPE